MFGFSTDEDIPANVQLVIDPSCIRLYGTYYGGDGYDWESGVLAVDKGHNVIFGGVTTSTNNIATTGAFQTTIGGGRDIFFAKMTASGVRLWGTYYGGPTTDRPEDCVTDLNDNIILAGITTNDTVFATPGAHQTEFYGPLWDGFVVKFNPDGQRIWGTYYGGVGSEHVGGCATDRFGNIYLAGETFSDEHIATPGSYQPTTTNSYDEGFLVKFDSNGVRQWGTYYGGEWGDFIDCCAADSNGNVFMAGRISSDINIASPGAFQPTLNGSPDAFIVGFTINGQRIWATYYGGSGQDRALGCRIDKNGNIYMNGSTTSPDSIASPSCHQPSLSGDWDGFMVKFNSSGQRTWGTYYGGPSYDQLTDCAVTDSGTIFLLDGLCLQQTFQHQTHTNRFWKEHMMHTWQSLTVME
ncbi:MAG: hypothetical protein HQ542_13635 [Bacteroidia bacterium]|nr:hypothetical protein [Bacteroidia bacterium]